MSKAKGLGVDMKSIMEQMAEHRKKRATSAELNKAALVEAIKPIGLTRIEVDFNGSGDSGQVDEVRYFIGKKEPKDLETIKRTLVQQAKINESHTYCETKNDWVTTTKSPTICYDLLSANHGGWEINEGSFGEFVFSFGKSNKIDLTFNQRVESVETSEETY